jgi:hypothetical protein
MFPAYWQNVAMPVQGCDARILREIPFGGKGRGENIGNQQLLPSWYIKADKNIRHICFA